MLSQAYPHTNCEYRDFNITVFASFPSYIMTGQNILIEKSKFEMASEDISMMYRLIMKK